jgi:serine/threonine-protein kinase HipA
MKQVEIFIHDKLAGMLTEDQTGFTFQYDSDYLNDSDSEGISLRMPLKDKLYHDKVFQVGYRNQNG